MMIPNMIGAETLNKLGKNINQKFRKVLTPLIKDGIGDKMDKGNLWIVPGFTLFAYAVLWTTKLSKLALEESTCRGASIYDFAGSPLDFNAQRHCQTAKRYYVAIHEPFQYDQKWREARQVKNPEWILWFWAPIVFVMYVLTRYLWTLLMENQGINFMNVVNASQHVETEYEGITEIDEEKLTEKLPVIAANFRCASSSNAFAAFICFEISLVLAPIILLLVILPLLIGGNYRTWGLDVAKAWWEKREWQGSALRPFFGVKGQLIMPLIPRFTYCDYHFVTLANDNVITYRCYLDANWHERTALFTWIMLVFLTFINFLNLLFWLLWALKMKNNKKRRKWVMKKWLNDDDFHPDEKKSIERFAKSFKMGNLLLFYYIEAHSDRVVASAFAKALYFLWMHRYQDDNVVLHQTTVPSPMAPESANIPPLIGVKNIGWKSHHDTLEPVEEENELHIEHDTPSSSLLDTRHLLPSTPKMPSSKSMYNLEAGLAQKSSKNINRSRKRYGIEDYDDTQRIYQQRKCSIM